ncbi:hypothetical protein IFM89_008578 [Coptis chinensis]|uniref:Uncharacterized protein n=1 Tax=Coptis chinensis TaxID=261450 RepID=A0A835I386_9MAGN|nr:hypothetical protein IFM89_008578 [Coptis chinensis]
MVGPRHRSEAFFLGLWIRGSSRQVSTFEAFDDTTNQERWDMGSNQNKASVVRDFADFCNHSYPLYLKDLRKDSDETSNFDLRFVHIPACIAVGLIGLLVEIPLYTIIAIVKSPYLLFIGWYRLLHDLISREGPFLETACIPIAGLTILLWPLVVVGSILFAIFSSIFVLVLLLFLRERSFRRGAFYVVAMVAEFDEYTNGGYIREKGLYYQRSMLALSGISPMISALSMDDSKSTSPIYLLPRFPNEIVEDRDWRVPIEAPKQMWLLHVGNALKGGM